MDFFFLLAQTKMNWRSLLTLQYSSTAEHMEFLENSIGPGIGLKALLRAFFFLYTLHCALRGPQLPHSTPPKVRNCVS